jgi:hypothetical protein
MVVTSDAGGDTSPAISRTSSLKSLTSSNSSSGFTSSTLPPVLPPNVALGTVSFDLTSLMLTVTARGEQHAETVALLTALTDKIDWLLEHFYYVPQSLWEKRAICYHCLSKDISPPAFIALKECDKRAAMGKQRW